MVTFEIFRNLEHLEFLKILKERYIMKHTNIKYILSIIIIN